MIHFSYQPPRRKQMKKRNTITRILSELRTHKKVLWLLLTLSVLIAASDIAVPLLIRYVIDLLTEILRTTAAIPTSTLLWLGMGLLLAMSASRGLKSGYNYRLFKLVTRLEDQLRFRAYENYLHLHALFHQSMSSGQIIGRLDRGATGIYAILNDVIGQYILPPLVIFAGIISTLFWHNALVGLVVFLPLPIYIALIYKLSRKIYEIEAEVNEQFETATREEYDVAANVLTVKKFSQELRESRQQQDMRMSARQTQYAGERAWATLEFVQAAVAALGFVAVFAVSVYLVAANRATIGEFVFFITLQQMAYQPLSQLSIAFPRARRNAARAERLFSLIDETKDVVDLPDATSLPLLAKEIRFENVSFRYPEKTEWTLENVNVAIPAKSVVAIVGRSGGGKTTFVNLLLRSFDPQAGKITIDKHDLRSVTQASLRAQIAVVPQEVDLFSRTVADNIRYGRNQATDQEVVAAAKLALAHDFIQSLALGYDSMVGERGLKLSGGERQRVGIARAVLKRPRILILDEATSHLDTESEQLVQKATETLMRGTTTIIIAHRLSTVLRADQILVFDEGKIVAQGQHQELLEKSQIYRRLYEMQFRDE